MSAELLASETEAPWKCCGCGRETADRVSNCLCPTGCLFRRIDGKSQSAVKFEHAAHARWPYLNPLEALLADALQDVMAAAQLGNNLLAASSCEVCDVCGHVSLPGVTPDCLHEPEEYAGAAVRSIMRRHGPALGEALRAALAKANPLPNAKDR